MPTDYDGDGKADPAVFQPDTGAWALSRSTEGGLIQTLGAGGASSPVVPAPADDDGDGKADFAGFDPSDGSWTMFCSSERVESRTKPFAVEVALPGPSARGRLAGADGPGYQRQNRAR